MAHVKREGDVTTITINASEAKDLGIFLMESGSYWMQRTNSDAANANQVQLFRGMAKRAYAWNSAVRSPDGTDTEFQPLIEEID